MLSRHRLDAVGLAAGLRLAAALFAVADGPGVVCPPRDLDSESQPVRRPLWPPWRGGHRLCQRRPMTLAKRARETVPVRFAAVPTAPQLPMDWP